MKIIQVQRIFLLHHKVEMQKMIIYPTYSTIHDCMCIVVCPNVKWKEEKDSSHMVKNKVTSGLFCGSDKESHTSTPLLTQLPFLFFFSSQLNHSNLCIHSNNIIGLQPHVLFENELTFGDANCTLNALWARVNAFN